MTFNKRLRYATLCAALSMPMLSCASLTQTGGTEVLGHADFCQIAKPISYARADTAITREQIAEHNCVGHRLCGWPAAAATCGGPGHVGG